MYMRTYACTRHAVHIVRYFGQVFSVVYFRIENQHRYKKSNKYLQNNRERFIFNTRGGSNNDLV